MCDRDPKKQLAAAWPSLAVPGVTLCVRARGLEKEEEEGRGRSLFLRLPFMRADTKVTLAGT